MKSKNAIDVTFLFRCERFTVGRRIMWIFLLLFLGGFSMLAFFVLYVWPLRVGNEISFRGGNTTQGLSWRELPADGAAVKKTEK